MQYDLDDFKTTVREHPAETIAVVSVVGLIGTLVYCRQQEKRHQIEIAKLQARGPSRMPRLGRRRRDNRYVIDFAA